MSDEYVNLDVSRAGVAVVTLNRPDVHNAFNNLVIDRLSDIFEELRVADGVRAVLIEGAGPSFSAGADLEWMRAAADYTHADNQQDALNLANMLSALRHLPQPTIALAHGASMGGGVGLVATCDIAVAERSAYFAFSEVRLGLTPATISPYVIEAMGARAARRYFLTGERFDAEEAYRLSLVHAIVDEKQGLADYSEELVQAIFKTAPGAVHAAKDLIDSVVSKPIDAGVRKDTAKRIADRRATDEGKEGTRAFLDKRAPSWAE
jgi:methylglutaconyl-CoA hydratase